MGVDRGNNIFKRKRGVNTLSVRTDLFFELLSDHHGVLEEIQREKQAGENRVRTLIEEYREESDDRSVEYIFHRLREARILQPLTEQHDSVFEVAPSVRDVLRFVNQDYSILGIESIESYFEIMDRNRKNLGQAIRRMESGEAKMRLGNIDEALRNVHREVVQNRQSIERRVDELNQSGGDGRSLKKRFQIIETLWQEYVKPLGKLVDPEERPREILSRVGKLLQEGRETFSQISDLSSSFRYSFQRLQYFLDVFQRSFDAVRTEIQPLRKKYRHNDRFLQGASHFLEAERRERDPGIDADQWFQFPLSRSQGISDDREIQKHFRKLFRYEPSHSVRLNPPGEEETTTYVSPFEIARELEEDPDVNDVMKAIINRERSLSLKVILQAYGYCYRSWEEFNQKSQKQIYQHEETELRLYPIHRRNAEVITESSGE